MSMWFDDVKEWTVLKDYEELKRNAEDRDGSQTKTGKTRHPST